MKKDKRRHAATLTQRRVVCIHVFGGHELRYEGRFTHAGCTQHHHSVLGARISTFLG